MSAASPTPSKFFQRGRKPPTSRPWPEVPRTCRKRLHRMTTSARSPAKSILIYQEPGRGTTALVFVWSAALIAGLIAMATYVSIPGARHPAPDHWPSSTAILRATGFPSLVVFIHPRCSCSRASLRELDRLVQGHPGLSTTVVLVRFTSGVPDRTASDLRDLAAAVPGVQVVEDPAGDEAEAFGAQTSGESFLYAEDGRLLFQGGLTFARGHEGLSAGQQAIQSQLVRSSGSVAECPTYGCRLQPL